MEEKTLNLFFHGLMFSDLYTGGNFLPDFLDGNSTYPL